MKTKQSYMKAVFTTEQSNAVNYSREKELTSYYKLIDKKTERVIVDCRLYMGRSSSANTIYCALWVQGIKTKPEAWEYCGTSGKGSASGHGYHKTSAAVGSAISSAGIELWGSPYGHPVNQETPEDTRKRLKKRAYIGGCGGGSIEAALCAIAYAAGYSDCILVQG